MKIMTITKKPMTARAQRQRESFEALHQLLYPGDTVYTVLRHVSRSGMQRRIDCFVVKEGQLVYLSGYMEGLGIATRHRTKNGLVVNGGGMDMGSHLVYALGSALWPNGTPTPHGNRNGHPDSTGDYALRHQWI